jgi:iron complex transport system ATP-binding protein
MMTPLLQIMGLSVEIERVPLLSDISLEMNAGEVVALVGPNGSGKTTLLRAIVGEQKLSAGSTQLNGEPVANWNPRNLAKRMAVLPQKSVLNFPFTGREVVALGRTPHETGQAIDQKIIDEVLDYLDADYLADRLYPNLSGGEQQRIQLARVLAQIWTGNDRESDDKASEPKLLLLDEPSSYFDLAHQQMLVELVQALSKRNIAVLIVVHDLNLALACADRIAVMSCGRLVTCGKAEEIVTPELIREVFSVDAAIMRDPETGRQMLSLRGLS